MRIQHNIAALNSYRQLGTNNSAISKNLEKLSSGYKINRAGDDAAGLAISEKMRAQITGLETAQKNANDGISLVQTAEGALTEVHSMLNRMVELATQSSNGTYDNEVDRANLQAEIESLTSEIDRIAESTNFNGINLLDGSLSENPATFEIDLSGMTVEGTVKAGDTFTLTIPGLTRADGSGVTITSKEAYGDEKTSADIAQLFDGQSLTIGGEKYTAKVDDKGKLTFTSKTRGELQTTQLPKDDTGVTVSSTNKSLTITADDVKVSNTVNGGVGGTGSTEGSGDGEGEGTEPTPATATTIKFDLEGLQVTQGGSGDGNLTDGSTLSIELASGVTLTSSAAGTSGVTGSDSEALAALFADQKVSIDGKTYTASVSGTEVTLTADEAGAPPAGTGQLEAIKGNSGGIKVTTSDSDGDTITDPNTKTMTVTDGKDEVKGTEEVQKTAAVTPKAGTEATKATFTIDFTNTTFTGTPNGSDTVTLNVGTESVTITPTAGATDIDKLLAEFVGEDFTIGGETYTAKVDGKKLIFEAGNAGVLEAGDTITNTTVSISGAGGLASAFGGTTPTSGTFANGTNAQPETPPTGDGNDDGTGTTTTNKSLTLQIGDTADSFNKISVSIGSMSAETLNIDDIDISTPKGAEFAIDKIKKAINTVSSQRGELGAIQNRLEHTINNLGVTTENITSAESRIRDTDMAEEMMAYTKNNILVQASQAMLAQANTLPQGVLQLLQ